MDIQGTLPMVKQRWASAAEKANAAAKDAEIEVVRFRTGDRSIQFNIDITAETVWATQQQITDLFDRDKSTISAHIKNIFDDNELDEDSVVGIFPTTAPDGKTYQVTHYNLDLILSVGYRVSSPKATQFRQWATKTLRAYIVDGYAINEARLRADPAATNRLAARLREIRADEKTVYASVRHFFKEAATDYDKDSSACKSFYARFQDKFHYAVTEKRQQKYY